MKLKDQVEGLLLRVQELNLLGNESRRQGYDELAGRLREHLAGLRTGDLLKMLRSGPLLLTLMAVLAVIGVGSTSMFDARIGLEVHELVEVQDLSFVVTTHTTELLPRKVLGAIHTYGKDYTVKFMITNSSLELGPYFEQIIVTVRLEASGGWSAETSTAWIAGAGASTGSIDVDPGRADYALFVTVLYESKGLPGVTGIGLSIWAEG